MKVLACARSEKRARRRINPALSTSVRYCLGLAAPHADLRSECDHSRIAVTVLAGVPRQPSVGQFRSG